MNIFARLLSKIRGERDAPMEKTVLKMITDDGRSFFSWDGKLCKSDIVRAAIRPKAKAIG